VSRRRCGCSSSHCHLATLSPCQPFCDPRRPRKAAPPPPCVFVFVLVVLPHLHCRRRSLRYCRLALTLLIRVKASFGCWLAGGDGARVGPGAHGPARGPSVQAVRAGDGDGAVRGLLRAGSRQGRPIRYALAAATAPPLESTRFHGYKARNAPDSQGDGKGSSGARMSRCQNLSFSRVRCVDLITTCA
jgi:hypothetical protein